MSVHTRHAGLAAGGSGGGGQAQDATSQRSRAYAPSVRKKDPNDVVDDFGELAKDSLITWQQMCNQLGDAGLKKNASVDAFLNVVIGWESFLSDWHIAAINRDSSAFTAEAEQWIKRRMAERPALAPLLSLAIPKHPDLALVRDLLDPTGRNIALWPKAKWIERATKELVNPYRAKVTAVSDRDHRLIDAAVQVRNCVAHRSRAATVAMNDALGKLSGGDAVLRRGARRQRSKLDPVTPTSDPRSGRCGVLRMAADG